MGGEDDRALVVGQLVEALPADVALDAQTDKSRLGLFVPRDLRRRVQGDRLPDRHDPVFGQPSALEKGAGRVGAVDLEALVL
jgi:hypothetical protein